MPKLKPKKTNLDKQIEQDCINIVDRERVNWEEAVSFITPKVAFRMRELIRILRKNYWGVFDVPIDKTTNREKIWINLAMSIVETWVKNIDMDTKDINFIARNPDGYDITELTRLVVKDYLDKMYFGETLDADERQVLIDGTVVWKTWEDKSSGKVVLKRRTIDLLNFYIDPTEENIQTAFRVTERGIFLASDLRYMTGWTNTTNAKGGDLPGSQVLNRADGSRRSNFGTKMTGEYRDVWECWGKIPKKLITRDYEAEDAEELVDGHIVVSGLEAPEPTMHLVELNDRTDKFGNTIKPYEEWRCAKITGRWYGLGVIERILALQEYLNIIVNIRINKHYVSQLGLFKIRKGKGITPQMLSRLSANGAIQLTDMDDIEPLDVPGDDGTSYKDEEVIKYWSQQISSAMPVSNGEIMPASATATANMLANAGAKTAYTLFKEGMGLFLERWIDRGALPVIAKTIGEGDLLRITREDDRFDELVQRIALNRVADTLENGKIIPSKKELLEAIQKEEEKMMKNPVIFVKAVQQVVADAVDTKVHITNEDLDSSATIDNIMNLMKIPPEQRDDDMVRQVFDLMGLSVPRKDVSKQLGQMQGQPQPGQPAPQQPQVAQPMR